MADRGIRSGGTVHWFFQRLTGILLVPILLVHLLTMHRYHEHTLPWESVTALLANPYWKLLELTFLIVALYHGLLGTYSVLQDWIRRPGVRLTLYSLVVLAGVVLLVFGFVTVLSIQNPHVVGAVGRTVP